MAFFIVFLGGGLGAALRHGVNLGVARLLGNGFPYATFFINVTGSFVMGLMAAWFAFKGGAPQHWRLFLTTGMLGGYTTFSTFSLDAALPLRARPIRADGGVRHRLGRARPRRPVRRPRHRAQNDVRRSLFRKFGQRRSEAFRLAEQTSPPSWPGSSRPSTSFSLLSA